MNKKVARRCIRVNPHESPPGASMTVQTSHGADLRSLDPSMLGPQRHRPMRCRALSRKGNLVASEKTWF